MKIFAYGSNMNIDRLKKRVPSARKVTNAFIKSYSLACHKGSKKDGSGKANITETNKKDDIVWGVIFEIDSNEKSKLDKAEGLDNGYNEMMLVFTDTENNSHTAQIYIADNSAIDTTLLPYDWYKLYIISGARQNGLPEEYIEKLDAIEYIVDPDEERRRKHLAVAELL